jgi:Crinkler effector protein N-terminal domain
MSKKIAEVRLNCLLVPDNIPADKITRQHLLTIDIGTEESVHSLRSKIKKECAPCFDDIPITEFVVRAVEFSSNDLANDNHTALFLSLKNGVQGTELSPISPISDITERLSKQSSKNDIHIVVYLKIKTPQ